MTTPAGGVRFGAGQIHALPDEVVALGHQQAFVVTDPGIAAAGILDTVLGILAAAGVPAEVFAEVEANPSTGTLDRAGRALRSAGPCAVVALGGGSSLDAAKGISLAATNQGPAATLDVTADQVHPGFPLIAVPTTAGTGAETNGFGVIEDTARHCKVYVGHASVTPRLSILDPTLTVGLPARVTAASGVDALVHGVESLTSLGRNPISQAYAHHALRLVHRYLPAAVHDGADLEARSQLLLGAHLAGLALSISGLGLVHGIAHAVTAHIGTPHGVALAAVLDQVLAFNFSTSSEQYAEIAFDLGVGDSAADLHDNAYATITAVRALTEQVGTYAPLSALGCTPRLLPALVRGALADPVTRNTPRMPSPEELAALLTAAL